MKNLFAFSNSLLLTISDTTNNGVFGPRLRQTISYVAFCQVHCPKVAKVFKILSVCQVRDKTEFEFFTTAIMSVDSSFAHGKRFVYLWY